uniref:Uncharacterized protein n=1 Tax=Rhizophora mucronata TaxID=61149 RepID=A0A2P2R3D2_RHIMU
MQVLWTYHTQTLTFTANKDNASLIGF